MTDFSKWNLDHRDLTEGEVEFLERVAQKVETAPLDRGKTKHVLTLGGSVHKIDLTLLVTKVVGLRLLSAPGWQCIWNSEKTYGNTVHTLLKQKFDTDLVMLRMYVA